MGLIGLSLLPTGLLFLLWGGLNPPSFRQHNELNIAAGAFFASCVGLYSLPFMLVELSRGRGELSTRHIVAAAAVCCCVTVVLIWSWPLRYCGGGACGFPTDGFLWRLAQLAPTVHGSSVLLFLLAAAGFLQVWWAAARRRLLPVWIFIAFAAVSIGNASSYQKYFDLVALMVVLLANLDLMARARLPSRAILVGMMAFFVAYLFYPFLAPTWPTRFSMSRYSATSFASGQGSASRVDSSTCGLPIDSRRSLMRPRRPAGATESSSHDGARA
jgi:hypothetical protein